MTPYIAAIYENGVFRPLGPVDLPDRTQVEVRLIVPLGPARSASDPARVRLPLVASKHPGSRQLTADRVAKLLDEDDLSS